MDLGSPRLLVFDLGTRNVKVPALSESVASLDVMRMLDGLHFQLYTNTRSDGRGLREISIVSLKDLSIRKLSSEEAKLNRQETVPWAQWKWPSDVGKPESMGVLRESDFLSAYEDWAIWKKGMIVTAGPGNAFDSDYRGFSAFDLLGRWMFRFPYVITPIVDDQGMGGKSVEASPLESYLLINGNAYIRDLFPSDSADGVDTRIEAGFVYRLLTESEWQSEKDFSARYVRMDKDLTSVKVDSPIDGRRFSVAPRETPLWGMYGRLTSDRVNLREKPSVSSRVLALMSQKVAGVEFKFVIRERTATKTRVGNLEDYWYRVTYEIPRGFAPDQKDHSWTGWIFGAYLEILPPEKQFGS